MTENFFGGQSWGFLDHFFDGVYIVDNRRKILFWSKSAEKITGYTKEEALGKCCADNFLRHVTSLALPGDSPSALIERADKNMYAAKQAGPEQGCCPSWVEGSCQCSPGEE